MLTYDEIVNVEFPKSAFGGYKADSVDDYIDEVANTVKTLLEQIKGLNDKVNELNNDIQGYKDTENSLHAALVIAQETGQKLVKESTEKSEQLIKDAEDKAAAIVSDAEIKAQDMIRTASEESSELMKKTKEKASEILKEALIKANSITSKAKENCANEEARYEDLKKKVSDFRTSMLLLYRSHVELLNEMRPTEDVTSKPEDDKVEVEEAITLQEADVSEPSTVEVEEVVIEEVQEDISSSDEIEEVDLTKINFSDFSDSSDEDNNEYIY